MLAISKKLTKPLGAGALCVGIILAASACSTEPTFGEQLRSQGADIARLGDNWVEGKRLVEKGEGMVKKGENLVEKGDDLVEDGQSKKKRGNVLVRDGRAAITKGEKMMREAEMTHSQRVTTP